MDPVNESIFRSFVQSLIASGVIDPANKSEKDIFLEAAKYVKKHGLETSQIKIHVTTHQSLYKQAEIERENGNDDKAISLLRDAVADFANCLVTYSLRRMGYGERQIEILSHGWDAPAKVFHLFAVFRDERPSVKFEVLLRKLDRSDNPSALVNYIDLEFLYKELDRIEYEFVKKGSTI